jgi:hypothetical protein
MRLPAVLSLTFVLGSVTAACSSDKVFTIGGKAVVFDVASFEAADVDGVGFARIFLSATSVCAPGTPSSATMPRMRLEIQEDPPASYVGDYYVGDSTPCQPVSKFPNTETTCPVETNKPISASVMLFDSDAGADASTLPHVLMAGATSGTVTITEADAQGIAGSLDLDFGSAGHLSGPFSGPPCAN